MFKRIIAGLACLTMIITAAGCGAKDVYSSEPETSGDTVVATGVNPLTGVKDLEVGKENDRPVAIMVNNVSVAQKVQTGVGSADIVYETEVEGGITRLMAVYQDISKLDKIGTVRSARYPYVDLAMGHNAVYIHCGQDPTYCAPHLNDVDDISIDTNSKGAKRIANGLASEHTLYALGADLWSNINGRFDTKAKSNKSWVTFAAENEKLTLSGGSAASVSVPFPASTTKFTYSEGSGLYTRLSKSGEVLTDYYTSEATEVKNVFILLTTISNYPDGKHRKVELTSGDGYYITNGTYTFIKWSKGNDSDSLKFTDTEGNDLKVSAGSSWVCIADKHTCQPTIQ